MRARCRQVSLRVEVECEICGSVADHWMTFGGTAETICEECGHHNPLTFYYEALRN